MIKLVSLILLPLLFFISCEDNGPSAPPVGTIPALSQLTAPESLYLISEVEHIISVHVEDPQGWDDIAQVFCSISLAGSVVPIKTISLNDDGRSGDIIPKDGTFTNRISADSVSSQTGNFTVVVKAIDASGNESEPLEHELAVIAGVENIPPTISNLSIPFVLDIQDTSDYLMTLKATDPQGHEDIDVILLQVFSPTSNSPAFQDTLWDNGNDGDATANDGIYSRLINIQTFLFYQPGKYSFKFQAFDRSGGASNSLVKIVKIIPIINNPPFVSNLIAPLTLQVLPDRVVTAVLELTVMDPQGLSDIWAVFFNSYRPDGSPSKSNPFKMYDDGETSQHGDQTANDGIYSLKINLPPGTPPGDYTFVFEAEDFLEAKSNQIVHKLKVIQ